MKTFTKDLNEEDAIYDGIIASGKDMLDNIDSKEEKQDLRGKLADLAGLWKRVHDELEERKENVSYVFDRTKVREEKNGEFDSWLSIAEKTLRELKPLSCLPDELEAQKKELNVSCRSFSSQVSQLTLYR